MPASIIAFVRYVETANRTIGRFAMYMIFGMMGLLLYSSISKAFFVPSLWTLEMAQFAMAAYYMLGGGYSMQLDSHVRMDIAYGSWTRKTQAFADSITAFSLIFYLSLLLYGGFSSTAYALKYNEESYSSWAPLMWPIKVIMTFGVAMMLLQAIAIFFKDLARVRGVPLDDVTPTSERVA